MYEASLSFLNTPSHHRFSGPLTMTIFAAFFLQKSLSLRFRSCVEDIITGAMNHNVKGKKYSLYD